MILAVCSCHPLRDLLWVNIMFANIHWPQLFMKFKVITDPPITRIRFVSQPGKGTSPEHEFGRKNLPLCFGTEKQRGVLKAIYLARTVSGIFTPTSFQNFSAPGCRGTSIPLMADSLACMTFKGPKAFLSASVLV